MNLSNEILSKIVTFSKYARYDDLLQRRETWNEIIDRLQGMYTRRFPEWSSDITSAFNLVREKKVLPSMRSMQLGGKAIERNESRIYNCAFTAIQSVNDFPEIMFMLLGGNGVGYSVQRHHVDKLPAIKKPKASKKFLIGDTIEGWSDAIKALMRAYLNGGSYPLFDYSDIRPKGAPLKITGGKAPGPQMLKQSIH